MLRLRRNITRKMLTRLTLLLALISVTVLADSYFDKNPDELKKIQTESDQQNKEAEAVYVITQTAPTNLKTSEQKNYARKLQVQAHDKYLRKHHQLRNYQELKEEVAAQTTPLIASYDYLVYQAHHFTADDDPMS